jgi:hypothetical protein
MDGRLYWMAILALVGAFKSHNRGALIIKSLTIILNRQKTTKRMDG